MESFSLDPFQKIDEIAIEPINSYSFFPKYWRGFIWEQYYDQSQDVENQVLFHAYDPETMTQVETEENPHHFTHYVDGVPYLIERFEKLSGNPKEWSMKFQITNLQAALPLQSEHLLAFWHFDHNNYDSSGNGNDGDIHGEETYSYWEKKYCLLEQSVGDYLSFNSSSNLNNLTNTYSIVGWFNLNDLTGYKGFYKKAANWDSSTASAIELYFDGARLNTVHNRGGNMGYRYWPSVDANTWIHIAVVWDGSVWRVYYNGVNQNSLGGRGSVASPNSEGNTFIGVGYADYPMNGCIDELMVYDCALSAEEVATLYRRDTLSLTPTPTRQSQATPTPTRTPTPLPLPEVPENE